MGVYSVKIIVYCVRKITDIITNTKILTFYV